VRHKDEDGWEWHSIDETVTKKLAIRYSTFTGVEDFDLCVSGDGLAYLQKIFGDQVQGVLSAVTVWARVSPQQKEFVLAGLKRRGHTTVMCGDGTNDVGALKQAHIGMFYHQFSIFLVGIPTDQSSTFKGIALLSSTKKNNPPQKGLAKTHTDEKNRVSVHMGPIPPPRLDRARN